jgi:hypothetical protein
VIELLQDDKLRSVINPSYQHQDSDNSPPQGGPPGEIDQFDDEEEMFEMMAMQEECRLEMMKFYIQSQNPKLFEEVYHGVSYPDEAPVQQPETTTGESGQFNQQQYQESEQQQQTSEAAPVPASDSSNTASLKDLIVNDLNTNASDFDPSQLGNLNLNDKN